MNLVFGETDALQIRSLDGSICTGLEHTELNTWKF